MDKSTLTLDPILNESTGLNKLIVDHLDKTKDHVTKYLVDHQSEIESVINNNSKQLYDLIENKYQVILNELDVLHHQLKLILNNR